jgi:hypothetical protein
MKRSKRNRKQKKKRRKGEKIEKGLGASLSAQQLRQPTAHPDFSRTGTNLSLPLADRWGPHLHVTIVFFLQPDFSPVTASDRKFLPDLIPDDFGNEFFPCSCL